MKEEILQIVKSCGIFTVISQVILHFCAGEAYEKYVKILSSLILVVVLLLPIYNAVDEQIFEKYQDKIETLSETFAVEASYFTEQSIQNTNETSEKGEIYIELTETVNPVDITVDTGGDTSGE